MPNYYVVNKTEPIKGEQILILLAKQFNDMEFFYPYYRLIEAGFTVVVAGLEKGDCVGKYNHVFPITQLINDIDSDNFDLLFIPGGKAPEELRKSPKVIELVQKFAQKKKPILSICHGPLVLADAGILKGKNVTCFPEVKEAVTRAGAVYHDAPVVKDGSLVTSRWPADLPYFMINMLEMLR
jgi:protease I